MGFVMELAKELFNDVIIGDKEITQPHSVLWWERVSKNYVDTNTAGPASD